MRGVLLDVSMSLWTAIQDYLTFKISQNWICNETSCDLRDNVESPSSPRKDMKPCKQQPVFEATVQYLVILDKELTSKSNNHVTSRDTLLFIPITPPTANDDDNEPTIKAAEGDKIEIINASSSSSTQSYQSSPPPPHS